MICCVARYCVPADGNDLPGTVPAIEREQFTFAPLLAIVLPAQAVD
jgi:hypothetical protein